MINDIPNHERVLRLLSDYRVHRSSEFRDKLQLLEYRKRISELRTKGHVINSLTIVDEKGHKIPAYQLERPITTQDFFR